MPSAKERIEADRVIEAIIRARHDAPKIPQLDGVDDVIILLFNRCF